MNTTLLVCPRCVSIAKCRALVQVGKINKFTVENVSTLKKRLKQLRERTAANKDGKDTEELLQARA